MVEPSDRPNRRASRSDIKALQRERQKGFVHQILQMTGVSKSALGKAIGAGEGTIAQFLDDDRHSGTLDAGLLQALVDWSGLTYPAIEPSGQVRFVRPNAVRWAARASKDDRKSVAIYAALKDRPFARSYEIKSDLPAAYVRTGDVVIVDEGAQPEDGDLVCCIFADGTNESIVFRIFNDPFLMSAQLFDPNDKPELRNSTTRRVVGVVTDVIRSR